MKHSTPIIKACFFSYSPHPIALSCSPFLLLLVLSLWRVYSRCARVESSQSKITSLNKLLAMSWGDCLSRGTTPNLLLNFLLTFKICPCWIMSTWKEKKKGGTTCFRVGGRKNIALGVRWFWVWWLLACQLCDIIFPKSLYFSHR